MLGVVRVVELLVVDGAVSGADARVDQSAGRDGRLRGDLHVLTLGDHAVLLAVVDVAAGDVAAVGVLAARLACDGCVG